MEKAANKLGLDDSRVLRKALEYERLLILKISRANNISDSARAVICLDLAAEAFNATFDLESALKLVALRKSAYNNLKCTVGKLLNLTDDININSLCVQLGCATVRDFAINLLENYQHNNIKNSDWSHPQYSCMAVYRACKIQKLKISKSSILPYSRLKLSQWKNLEEEWIKIDKNGLKSNLQTEIDIGSNNSKKKNQDEIKDMSANSQKSEITSSSLMVQTQDDYNIWKERILKAAREEIAMQN